jgi:hypothetical protein
MEALLLVAEHDGPTRRDGADRGRNDGAKRGHAGGVR